jgi:hypothetical protein
MPNEHENKGVLTVERFEKFAGAIQEDLRSMKSEIGGIKATMATKEDVENARGDLGTRISGAKEQLQEQINGLHYAKEIDELRGRVTKVEEKVGIQPPRYKPA